MSGKGKYQAIEVAKYFIELASKGIGDDAGAKSLGISHLKLQKLIFFAQVYYLAKRDETLFDDEIVAWKYGPVVENVWEVYKDQGADPIKWSGDETTISLEDQKILEQRVWFGFGAYSAGALVEMTHAHTPWKEAFQNGNSVITHEAIKSYYPSLIFK